MNFVAGVSGIKDEGTVIYGILGMDDTVLTFSVKLQSNVEVSDRIKELLKSIGIGSKDKGSIDKKDDYLDDGDF